MSSKLWTEEQFNCPVCLDLPSEPVTIPCGHSYCMSCIKDYWSKDQPTGVYSCPQCRQTFCPKPSLSRNTMLAEAVEQLRAASSSSRGTPSSSRGTPSSSRGTPSSSRGTLSSAAVLCDICKGEPTAAVRSCLVCMSSFCEAHLKPHRTKKTLKQHELIGATANLPEKICTQHKYLHEFFCRQCHTFICWLCTSNEHQGHDSVATKTERLRQQAALVQLQAENQQQLRTREQQLKDVKKVTEAMKRSADGVRADTEQTLGELRLSVERLQELLEELLERSVLEKLQQAQEVREQLEDEVQRRRRRDEHMTDLISCQDHIHFLQTYEALSRPLEDVDLPAVHVHPDVSFEPVRHIILDLRERVEELCNQELSRVSGLVNDTTPFTLGDANRGAGQKGGGILKLFNALSARSPRPATSTSAAARNTDRRVQGWDVRSRDIPQVRDSNHRAPPSPAPSPGPTPTRRETRSLWSRSSHNPVVPVTSSAAAPAPAPVPAPVPAPAPAPAPGPAPAPAPAPAPGPAPAPASSAFSRMASVSSISSFFRSHRRGNASRTAHTPAAAANPWTTTAGTEAGAPPEVNPGLFLDSPVDTMNHAPAFPALRELNLSSFQEPEPRTREEFLQYAVTLTFDPSTAHRRLCLSEGDTKATLQATAQEAPLDYPQRFDGWTQVMCVRPLGAARCYWEVEWRGRGSSLGVAYGAMGRKGSDARAGLGYNAQSWTLELSDTCCAAMHAGQREDVPVTYCPRLGVFLDTDAGSLAFYSVAENMTPLHTFHANFTQPLYAAFGVGSGVGVGMDFALGHFSSSVDSVKICPI